MLLALFAGSVSAEELFMKCGDTTYKYSTDPSGDTIFLKNIDPRTICEISKVVFSVYQLCFQKKILHQQLE